MPCRGNVLIGPSAAAVRPFTGHGVEEIVVREVVHQVVVDNGVDDTLHIELCQRTASPRRSASVLNAGIKPPEDVQLWCWRKLEDVLKLPDETHDGDSNAAVIKLHFMFASRF